MISQIKQKGFTIVELLIVIVVIAILAALSYVGYTSITARANTSTATAAAKAVRDAAQTFNGAHGSWPVNKTAFTSGVPASGSTEPAVAKLPSDITFAASTSTSDPKTVVVQPHGTSPNFTGFTVTYRNFSTNEDVVTRVGDTSGTAGAALPN